MVSVLSSPSVTSVVCTDARSICEYDFTTPTRSEIRRSIPSPRPAGWSSTSVLAIHSKPGPSGVLSSSTVAATCSHQSMSSPAAASAGAISQSRSTSWSANQSVSSSSRVASASGPRLATGGHSMSRRSLSTATNCAGEIDWPRKLSEGGQHGVGGFLQGIDGAAGRRSRVVDLVGEAGRESAERDQRLTLPGHRFDVPDGLGEPRDEVHAEREPGIGKRREAARRAPAARGWSGRQRPVAR